MRKNSTKSVKKQPDFVSISDVYFDRIKHYQDNSRQMIWIKLYLNLLDDVDFCLLSDDCKFHFLGLLLLAAKLNNRLPNNPQFLAQKLSATSEIDVEILLSKKLLIPFKASKTKDKSDSNVLSDCYQNPCLEEKRREEKRMRMRMRMRMRKKEKKMRKKKKKKKTWLSPRLLEKT